jgi:hypothetical protein
MDATSRTIQRKAGRMIKFPIDCPLDCPHMTAWDMSVDDWTYVCDELKTQIDGCDTFFKSLLPNCPIEAERREE